MSGTASNVKVWAEIEVYVADVGATAPTTPDEDPGSGWDPIGFLSSDGIPQELDEDSNTLKSYEGVPVGSISTFNKSTFGFTAIEDNDVVKQAIYQGSDAPTTATGVKTFVAKIPKRVPRAWLLHFHTGDDHAMQIVKKGTVSGVDLVDKKADDLGGATITVSRLATSGDELFTELSTDSSSSG
jgi:hypothetical protein